MVEGRSCQPCFFGRSLRDMDFEISAFGFRAAHGGHAILSVLAVFIDGMTVCALMSERVVFSTLQRSRTRPCTPLPQGSRLGDFRATQEVSKARGSPGR